MYVRLYIVTSFGLYPIYGGYTDCGDRRFKRCRNHKEQANGR